MRFPPEFQPMHGTYLGEDGVGRTLAGVDQFRTLGKNGDSAGRCQMTVSLQKGVHDSVPSSPVYDTSHRETVYLLKHHYRFQGFFVKPAGGTEKGEGTVHKGDGTQHLLQY